MLGRQRADLAHARVFGGLRRGVPLCDCSVVGRLGCRDAGSLGLDGLRERVDARVETRRLLARLRVERGDAGLVRIVVVLAQGLQEGGAQVSR